VVTDDDGTALESYYLYFDRVIVDIGPNIGLHVKSRVLSYLQRIAHLRVQSVHQFNESSYGDVLSDDEDVSCNNSYKEHLRDDPFGGTLILSLGNTEYSLSKIPQAQLISLPAESFQVQFDRLIVDSLLTTTIHGSMPIYYLVCNGLPLNPTTHTNVSFNKQHVHYGAVVCAYDALERLGYAFLHPLEPYIPPQLRMRVEFEAPKRNHVTDQSVGVNSSDQTTLTVSDESSMPGRALSYSVVESPYWPERGFHLHTQHPLELTEVLQGHDIPQFGPHGKRAWLIKASLTHSLSQY